MQKTGLLWKCSKPKKTHKKEIPSQCQINFPKFPQEVSHIGQGFWFDWVQWVQFLSQQDRQLLLQILTPPAMQSICTNTMLQGHLHVPEQSALIPKLQLKMLPAENTQRNEIQYWWCNIWKRNYWATSKDQEILLCRFRLSQYPEENWAIFIMRSRDSSV